MTTPESIDLHYVTDDVQGGTWLQWATSVTNITDLVDRALAAAGGPPRKCISRLIIAAHGAENTNGFTVFDANTAGVEYIDGGSTRAPLGPGVEAQLARLRPFFCAEAIVEFRVCRFGTGTSGERAMQLVSDILGVPVTAPVDEISSLAAIGGLATDWRTVYPADWGRSNTTSFWVGEPERKPPTPSTADIAPTTGRTVTGQFVPLPGVNPPTLTPPLVLPNSVLSGNTAGGTAGGGGGVAPTNQVSVAPNRISGNRAAAVAAGIVVVAAGVGLVMNTIGGGSAAPATSAAETRTTRAQTAASPRSASARPVVRVSPIEAVFTQATFSTEYAALVAVEPPDDSVFLRWSGPDCGTVIDEYSTATGRATYVWSHPHPPCDATTDHSTRRIVLEISWGRTTLLRCVYQGAASGVGPPCTDEAAGVTTTPVGGGR